MSLRKSALYLLTALLLVAVGLTPVAAAPEKKPTELPLGNPGLKENRSTEQVAPGVTYTRILRGEQSKKDVYTVDVAFEADRTAAQAVADELEEDG